MQGNNFIVVPLSIAFGQEQFDSGLTCGGLGNLVVPRRSHFSVDETCSYTIGHSNINTTVNMMFFSIRVVYTLVNAVVQMPGRFQSVAIIVCTRHCTLRSSCVSRNLSSELLQSGQVR